MNTYSFYLSSEIPDASETNLVLTHFQILLMSEEISPAELDFFLRFPVKPHVTSPVDFLSNTSWGGICSLAGKDEFRNLDRDIETSPKRWKKIVEVECPEREKFPQVCF